VQGFPADAQRLFEILVGTGAEAVDRYGESVDAKL
jgi:hypothetical protein